jgi:hypothetical protein
MAELSKFEGLDPHSIRLVWDQHAHSWFGERCLIIFLALPAVSEASRIDVEALVDKAGIKSFTCYLAYGSYDIVLRFWATHYEKDSLVKDINAKYSHPEMEVFEVDDIDYSRWSSVATPADEETVVKKFSEIQDFLKSANDPRLESRNQELAKSLIMAGLLHKHELATSNEVMIRVYIVLRRRMADSDNLNEMRLSAIQQALGRLEFLSMPSVYYGRGRSVDCVLKGFIPASKLPGFHHEVISLRQRLEKGQIDLRPMTLILAQDGEVDCDFLRVEIPGLERPEVRRLRLVLRVEAFESWKSLTEDFQNELAKSFSEAWPKFADTAFARPLLDLVEGLVLRDGYRVNGSLNFLLSLEAKFRAVCIAKILAPIAPNGGFLAVVANTLKESAEKADDPKMKIHLLSLADKKPSELAFGEMYRVVDELIKAKEISQTVVDDALGAAPPWSSIPGAIGARNNYAHGRMLWTATEDPVRWWELYSKPVLLSGSFYAALDQTELP